MDKSSKRLSPTALLDFYLTILYNLFMTNYQIAVRQKLVEYAYGRTALNVPEIAEIFKVSKQTIYTMTEDLPPKDESQLEIIKF